MSSRRSFVLLLLVDGESVKEIKPSATNDTLTYSKWWSNGTMVFDRDALDYNHPEQTYNHLRKHGIEPEKWGIKHPMLDQFKGMNRSQLINLIMEYKKVIREMHNNVE